MQSLRPSRTSLITLGALLALASPTAAQPQEEEPEETGSRTPEDDRTRGIPPADEEKEEGDAKEADPEDPLGDEEPSPPPPPTPTVAPYEGEPASRSSSTASLAGSRVESGGDRPQGFSAGLGVGYDFPADLRQPNTVTARFRFSDRLAIEPRVRASVTRSKVEMPLGVDSETTTTDLLAAAALRYSLIQRGKADFVAVGGASLAYQVVNPDGGSNDTRTTDLALFAGIGVQYWLTSHWAISVTTTNSLFSYERQSMDQAGGEEITTSNLTAGLVFDPDVVATVLLFF